ncbi:MAG: hypothetical protein N2378_04535 [Chloroflexaceae bacterium]|nr:hypothetical protein [Chloroflexaceae bacterium]
MKPIRFPLAGVMLLVAFSLLTGSLPPRAAARAAPSDIPAPLPGNSPTATVNLSATSGSITQLITVSGQTNTSAAGVRVMWVYNDAAQTVTAAVVNTAGNSYSAQVSVPLDAQPGPARVCATVTGSATARLTCATFTVTAPPTRSVSGQAPAPAAGTGATFHLLDRSGRSVASAAIAANGAFQLNNVAPGRYRGAVEGGFSQLARFSDIVVTPNGDPSIAYFPWEGERDVNGVPCLFSNDAKVALVSGTPSHLNSFGIVDLDTSFSMKAIAPYYQGASPKPKPQSSYDFGIYLSGVPLTVEFQAYVQRKGNVAVERVEYYRQIGNAAPVLIGSATAKPWTFQYNVGQLPPGQIKLIAVPVVNGQQQCATFHTIQMLANPTASSRWQPGAVSVWDNNLKIYRFWGTMPNVAGLPLVFDTPSLPLVGVLQNRLGAGVYVEGALTLDGQVWLSAMEATAYARLMSINVYNQTLDLDPGGKTLGKWFKPNNYASVVHYTPRFPLASFRKDLTIFGGPLFAVPPWVVVRASISIGVGGELSLSAAVYPLRPGLEAELRPSVSAWLGLTIAADVLFGIAGAEGTAQPGVTVALPFKVNVDNDPPAWFDDPCLTIFVRLIIKGRFLFWSWTILDEPVVNTNIPSGCNARQAIAQLQALAAQPAATSALEAPALAADPNGRMVMVYVEDAGGATPAPRVMARFKPAGSDVWGTAIPVTEGSRSVSDPVVAFAGPGYTPIVAWTQNTLPLATASPTGGDLGETLRRQEIYVSAWNGAAWSAPIALTDDLVGDGRPAIAGDIQGATLAWTRDTDGDLRTRTDQRIAVREWTALPGTPDGSWSNLQLLGAAPTGGMNAQVAVARLFASDPATGQQRRILVWTFDADGDPNTVADRRLASATPDATGTWNPQLLSELTRRSDSPTVALNAANPNIAELAFLVRGVDADGQTDIGPLSNRAELWTAQLNLADGSVFNAARAPGENGETVYAERPRLTSAANGETLLAFRRFGQPNDNTWLGQVALARRAGAAAAFSAPLLLTNEPRQNRQAAIALNPANGQAVVARIGSPPVLPVGIAADEHLARLAAQSDERFVWVNMAAQTSNDTTLDIVTLRPEADPALDPTLALGQTHAAAGSTVTVTATVRNLGRNTAPEARVCLYRGVPGSGTLVECRGVPPLGFNESRQVVIGLVAAAGAQPIYAEVIPTGEDANSQNNRGVADLGALPAPQAVGVQEGTLYESSLAVQWLPLDVPGVAGYRILRSTQPGGPYELVGEATGAAFNDLPASSGQTFYYVVQAYDAAGVVSPYSREVSAALPRLSMYLPVVMR